MGLIDQSWFLWVVAIVIVTTIVLPYYIHFRRRLARESQRLTEAARSGIDRPAAQYPYIDSRHCIGCGACVDACPEGDVLGVVGGTAVVINGLRCVGHAHCETVCPVGAIEVGLGDLKSRTDLPLLDERLRTSVLGIYVVGELGGLSLVRNAVRQGRSAAETIAAQRTTRANGEYDVAIVGAGPAGISAALTASHHGLSHVILERERDLGGTLLHYPRRKMVLTQPVEFPPWGKLDRSEYRKEQLLEIFQQIVGDHRLNLRFGEMVKHLSRDGDRFRIETGVGAVTADHVILAQGRRGLPRKLNVPGEELAKVMYGLVDAASYRNQRILVVGGGDSAVEAAVGLSCDTSNRVTLSYRRDRLVRVKKKNQDSFAAASERGRVDARFGTEVARIDGDQVHLRKADGTHSVLLNDYVFIFAGGLPPLDLLRAVGAQFGGSA